MLLTGEIQLARNVWGKAQILEASASWGGYPEEAAWVDRFVAKDDPKMDWHLWHMASDDQNIVSAYAIQTLLRRRSPLLLELPDELDTRSGHVTIQRGSFRQKMLYRDFVRSVIRQMKEEHDGKIAGEIQ